MYEVLHFNQESMEQLTMMHWICVDVDYSMFFPHTDMCILQKEKKKELYSHSTAHKRHAHCHCKKIG